MSRDRISFTSLPVEIRHGILSFTDLVPASRSVLVRNGRLTTLVPYQPPDSLIHWQICGCDRCSQPFHGLNLLNVRNKSFRNDSHFVLFSSNQLEFRRHPAGHLKFLQEKQAWVHYIRDMHFTFTVYQIDRWVTGAKWLCQNLSRFEPPGTGQPPLDQTWTTMARFIRENVPLDTLSLTLNNWEAREEHVITNCDESVLPNVIDSYKSIVDPFKGWGQHGLKRFVCLWALFIDHEEEAEREVMGDDYVPSGKLTPESRY